MQSACKSTSTSACTKVLGCRNELSYRISYLEHFPLFQKEEPSPRSEERLQTTGKRWEDNSMIALYSPWTLGNLNPNLMQPSN